MPTVVAVQTDLAAGEGWRKAWHKAAGVEIAGSDVTLLLWTADVMSVGLGALSYGTYDPPDNGKGAGCEFGCGVLNLGAHVLGAPLLLLGPILDVAGAGHARKLLGLKASSDLAWGALVCEVGALIVLPFSYSFQPRAAATAFGFGAALDVTACVFELVELGRERRLAMIRFSAHPDPEPASP